MSSLCCHCSLSSGLRCSICYAPYCSESCQTTHWYRHIASCRSPPPLITDSKYKPLRKPRTSSLKLRLPELPPLLVLDSIRAFNDMTFLLEPREELPQLEEAQLESKSLEEPLPPLFVVFHPEMHSWVRATQIHPPNEQGLIPVLYVDLGTRGLATEARASPPNCLQLPARAISVSLHEVKPAQGGEESTTLEKMKKLVLHWGKEFLLEPLGSSREGHIFVRLLDQEGKDLAEELIAMGVLKRAVGQDFIESYTKASASKVVLSKALIKANPPPLTVPKKEDKSLLPSKLLLNGGSKMNGGGSPKAYGEKQVKHLLPITPAPKKKKKCPPGSLLDGAKAGVTVDFKVSKIEGAKDCVFVFCLKSKEAERYLNSTMQKETNEKLESFDKGDEVKVEISGFYYRALALSSSQEAQVALKCVLLDYGSTASVPRGRVFALAAPAYEFKSCGAILKCIDESSAFPPQAAASLLSTRVRLVVGGVILVDFVREGKSYSLVALPFPFYDAQATLALGAVQDEIPPPPALVPSLLSEEEVNFLSFGDLSNEAYIRSKNDEDHISIMSTAFYILDLNEFKLKEDPLKDKIYACKWSDDDFYYRAQVKGVNKKASKVKVYFIDYGNSAVQDISRLSHLPKIFTSVPPFSLRVQLKGVAANSGLESTLNKLRGELETLSLTVKFEDGADSASLYSNGNAINNLINEVIHQK